MRTIDADKLLRDIEKYHVSDGKFQHWVQIQPTIEPEPCEDAVSRKDVQSIAERSDWFESSDSFNDFMWALYALPSVTPKI